MLGSGSSATAIAATGSSLESVAQLRGSSDLISTTSPATGKSISGRAPASGSATAFSAKVAERVWESGVAKAELTATPPATATGVARPNVGVKG